VYFRIKSEQEQDKEEREIAHFCARTTQLYWKFEVILEGSSSDLANKSARLI